MTRVARSSATRRRAVVTGGAGFIGGHLVERLQADGTDVLIVDDLSTGSVANVGDTRIVQLDIARDPLDATMRSWRPDVVFHLAAQASVPRSIKDPDRDLAVNVVGTHRVAAAALAAGAGRLVFISSGGAIYGDTERNATERTPPAPTSYYGVHKLAAEGHVRLAGLPWSTLRPSNVYGPRQSPGLEGAVVAAFLDQARAGGPLHIHGDGLQTRDFLHVTDLVDAVVLVGRPDSASGTWNVASGRAISILDLATHVEREIGRPLGREFGPARPGDVRRSAISARRLRALGWRRATTLSDGIAGLVAATLSGDD